MVMIKCSYCHKEQDSISDFYWIKCRRQVRCKTCQKQYVKTWQKMHVDKLEKNLQKASNDG